MRLKEMLANSPMMLDDNERIDEKAFRRFDREQSSESHSDQGQQGQTPQDQRPRTDTLTSLGFDIRDIQIED